MESRAVEGCKVSLSLMRGITWVMVVTGASGGDEITGIASRVFEDGKVTTSFMRGVAWVAVESVTEASGSDEMTGVTLMTVDSNVGVTSGGGRSEAEESGDIDTRFEVRDGVDDVGSGCSMSE